MKKTLLSLAILTLSGCVANQYLQPIPNVENARLRTVSVPSNNITLHEGSTKECVSTDSRGEELAYMAKLGAKANLLNPLNRIDMPAYNTQIIDAQQNEFYIPANEKFLIQFNGVGIAGFSPGQTDSGGALYSWCRKVLSFTPKANANYEALYDYVKLPNGKKTCGVKLFEIVEESTDKYSKVAVEDYKVIEN